MMRRARVLLALLLLAGSLLWAGCPPCTPTPEGEGAPIEGQPHEGGPAEGEPKEGDDPPPGPVYYTYEVQNAYPHDREAFTQGLEFDGAVLYEGTGLYGESSLRRVDLVSGAVIESVPLDRAYFGEGITILGERIFQLTWTSRVGFVYDRTSLAQTGEVSYTTEGWGLTNDGTRLIMSDGTENLYFHDPETFALLGSVVVRDGTTAVRRLNELEYVKGQVYANVWQTDRIAIVNPADGVVTGWIDLRGILTAADRTEPVDVLNGIAYDDANDRLYVTGKLWPKLFEIRLTEVTAK